MTPAPNFSREFKISLLRLKSSDFLSKNVYKFQGDKSDYVTGKIFVRRSYVLRNIHQMEIFVTCYLPTICLVNKWKKCASLSKVSKTMDIQKIMPSI